MLLRRYIEAMALQDDIGVGRPVYISRDELSFLAEVVMSCGRQDEYAEMLSHIFEVALRWRYGKLDLPPEVVLREVLSLLSTQNRILEYEVKTSGPAVIASFSAPSKSVGTVISLSLAKLLNSIGVSTRVRSAGTTFLIEVRKA